MILISCSEDEEDGIIGEWELSSISISCPDDDLELDLDGTDGCVEFIGDVLCLKLIFSENGIVNIEGDLADDLDSSQGSYTLADNGSLSICEDIEGSDCISGMLSNGTIILNELDDGCRYMQSLTRSWLPTAWINLCNYISP